MKKKYFLIVAAVLMIVVGILRAFGGFALLIKGNQLETDVAIIASNTAVMIVAIGLLIIGVLLILSAINLLRKLTKNTWKFCWIILILFLLDGLLNGYLLFSKPLDTGQQINFIFILLTGLFLFLGKPALKE